MIFPFTLSLLKLFILIKGIYIASCVLSHLRMIAIHSNSKLFLPFREMI